MQFFSELETSRHQEEAQTAIQELNGTELGSRPIEVREDSKTGGGAKGGNKAGPSASATSTSAATTGVTSAVAPISGTS